MKTDYSSCTLEELHDVHSHIDKVAYPQRYQELLKELTSRETDEEESVKKPDTTKNLKTPKRKRTNKDKIITSYFVLTAAAACWYFEKIPGKNGGLTIEDDPIAFWVTIVVCVGLAISQLLTLESNEESSVSDT